MPGEQGSRRQTILHPPGPTRNQRPCPLQQVHVHAIEFHECGILVLHKFL